ncbi:Ectonucleoside triphosphate diphosphohydrolase 7 [Clonorchis sinensis]|uniref:Ectonucleoside triphosphate diphosphohydrolase 7 n=1 Tax=Clonorchis sinensis TaxID=79923 RepID=A0A3R7GQ31_CLOSI|nr:Ectonucleoside triphosphate diphosphohydrolase 7 [Clonorchis sinensis]
MRPFAHRKIEERPSTDMLLRDFLICILQMTVAHALVIPGDMKFAVMVDAGSSGSRVYVYTWRDGGGLKTPELLRDEFGEPVVKKVSPGLSSFAKHPKDAKQHIADLLDFAKGAIPKASLTGTHVYVFATAGMRLLPIKEQCLIWRHVRSEIRNRYPFKFANTDARTISGDDEALFGWIAVNYLLHRFGLEEYSKKKKSTYGMLDLGGASMQVAFELGGYGTKNSTNIFPLSLRTKSNDDDESSIQSYDLFLHSYLSYGANVMRKRHEEVLLYDYLPPWADPEKPVTIRDPCLQKGLTINATLSPRKPNETEEPRKREVEKEYQVQFFGGGDPDKCKVLVRELVLGGEMGREPAPPIWFEMPFYGLSEFFYALEGVSSKEIYVYSEAVAKIDELCKRPWDEYTKILRGQYGDEET